MTTTSMPAARAAATSSTEPIPQSTVMTSPLPRWRSFSTLAIVRPYPSASRSGISQSHSAPSERSVETRIAVELTPSTS